MQNVYTKLKSFFILKIKMYLHTGHGARHDDVGCGESRSRNEMGLCCSDVQEDV